MNATTFDIKAAAAPITRTLDGAFKLKLRDFTAYASVRKMAGRDEFFYVGDTGNGYFTEGADADARTGWSCREDAEIAVTLWMQQLWNDHAHPEAR